MDYLRNFKPEAQAALSHLLLRVLCILIIEHACAQLVQQSSGTPAVAGNYVLATLFGLGFVVALINRKIGFAIGIGAGIINIIVKMVVLTAGHEHFPYYPVVWITQSALVVFFCALACMAARRDNN